MLTLLFIRHAESVGNQQHRMQGHADYGLSDQGQDQAQRLAQRLAAEFGSPTCLYSSPIRRAKQTAQLILKYQSPSITPMYDDRLCEGHQGIFQGLTWMEACKRYPDLCHQLETSLDWIPVPNAETPLAVRQRATAWLEDMLNHHQDGDRLWVVAHEWILYHLISVLLGSDRTWQMPIAHTGLFEFSLNVARWSESDVDVLANSSLWQLRRFNDVQHLSANFVLIPGDGPQPRLCNNN